VAEIIEVKQVPWTDKAENLIAVTSVDDLNKIAEIYQIPVILKKGKEQFIYVDALKSVITYKA